LSKIVHIYGISKKGETVLRKRKLFYKKLEE
jgi:hypothetical protein